MRKHVVFVMDASRSMGKMDVCDNGEWKRRVTAVLDVCFEFIQVRRVYAYAYDYTATIIHTKNYVYCCDNNSKYFASRNAAKLELDSLFGDKLRQYLELESDIFCMFNVEESGKWVRSYEYEASFLFNQPTPKATSSGIMHHACH